MLRHSVAGPDEITVVPASSPLRTVRLQLLLGAESRAGVRANFLRLGQRLFVVAAAHAVVRLRPRTVAAAFLPAVNAGVRAAAHLVLLGGVRPARVLRALVLPPAFDPVPLRRGRGRR